MKFIEMILSVPDNLSTVKLLIWVTLHRMFFLIQTNGNNSLATLALGHLKDGCSIAVFWQLQQKNMIHGLISGKLSIFFFKPEQISHVTKVMRQNTVSRFEGLCALKHSCPTVAFIGIVVHFGL